MSVSIVFARSLAAEFVARRLDASMLLGRSKLSTARLRNSAELLNYDEAARLARFAVELSQDEAIGHTAGWRTPPTALPLLSAILFAQKTLLGAAHCFTRYSPLMSEGAVYSIREDGDQAIWSFVPSIPPNPETRVMAEFAVAVAVTIAASRLRISRGSDFESLAAVHFQHEQPADTAIYAESYGCPIVFGSTYNGVVFARELLGRPLQYADEIFAERLHAALERRLRYIALARTWVARVRFVLAHRADFINVDGPAIATAMDCSERTLRRHLEREGATAGDLLNEARCRFARRALRRGELSVGEIGRLVGFESASAFCRAFRSWTGETPTRYRGRDGEHISE